MLRSSLGFLGAVWVLSVASAAHAQCAKDTDCKGDRVCENGACVTPAAAAPLPPQPAPGAVPAPTAPPVPTPAPAAAAPAPAPAESGPAPAPVIVQGETNTTPSPLPDPPVRRRHSTGMMVGGIVMVSFVPVALLVSLVASAQQSVCEATGSYDYGYDENGVYGRISTEPVGCDDYDPTIYGGLISAAVLGGVGIPLIVVGAKKEPVERVEARITPWATPQGAGVGLRIDM